jgi:hypothetical protein
MLTSNWNQNQISIIIIIKITFRLWTQFYIKFQFENLILKNRSLKKKKNIQNMGWWWLHVGSKPLIMVATCSNPHITQWGL